MNGEADVVMRPLLRLMRFARRRRSAGVPVSAQVHRLLRQADAKRGRGDWSGARDLYDEVLRHHPSLGHIWMQLGHASGEIGDHCAAQAAYRRSMEYGTPPAEAWLHIGHALKRGGRQATATAAYVNAVAAAGGQGEAAAELARSMSPVLAVPPDLIVMAARTLAPIDVEEVGGDAAGTGDGSLAIVFDLSDLIAHFRHHRLPTGIQRFQLEIAEKALDRADVDSRFCCYVNGRDTLVEVPRDLLRDVIRLARGNKEADDDAWSLARTALFVALATREALWFRTDEVLFNLGTSWWIYEYPLLVRTARQQQGVRLITMVFDLIPRIAPAFCVRGIAQDYTNWLIDAFEYTDVFVCISRSTADDLRGAAAELGVNLEAECVRVVPLDADFRAASDHALPADALSRFALTDRDYVLYVSTIEPRKNHVLVLAAWEQLVRRHGVGAVPLLVFVGRNGWLNATVYDRLGRSEELVNQVKIIESASDDELALLYRHCRLTVYPSFYEGWGLPVTESLCYEKVPVVADNSSLPEAGGEWAVYFESGSATGLVDAIEHLLFDAVALRLREAKIAETFAPRSWAVIGDELVLIAQDACLVARRNDPPVPTGHYIPIGRRVGLRIWRGLQTGDRFRSGAGWHWPDDEGVWTRPGGGTLTLRTDLPSSHWRLYVSLRGLPSQDCPYAIIVGHARMTGAIEAKRTRWAKPLAVEADVDGILNIDVVGYADEHLPVMKGGQPYRALASLGVVGFALLGADDMTTMLAAIVTDDLDLISAFREPARSTSEAMWRDWQRENPPLQASPPVPGTMPSNDSV